MDENQIKWPNQQPVVDGVEPVSQTPQGPDDVTTDDDDVDREMEV